MSYCRFSEDGSDVYVIGTGDGFQCYCNEPGNFTDTEEGMIAHLSMHKRAGLLVPDRAVHRLWSEVGGPRPAVNPEIAEAVERVIAEHKGA